MSSPPFALGRLEILGTGLHRRRNRHMSNAECERNGDKLVSVLESSSRSVLAMKKGEGPIPSTAAPFSDPMQAGQANTG